MIVFIIEVRRCEVTVFWSFPGEKIILSTVGQLQQLFTLYSKVKKHIILVYLYQPKIN